MDNSVHFNKVINNKDFVSNFGIIKGQQHKRLPKEFVEAAKKTTFAMA